MRYEDLNSTGSNKSYQWHIENGSDWEKLAKDGVAESWPDYTDKELLFG